MLAPKKEFIPYILLSYPRSGNHWLRYIVEWFSSRPTLGDKEGEHPNDIINDVDIPIYKRVSIPHVNPHISPIAKKRHFINAWDDKNAKVVLVIRNYKECIVRHMYLGDHTNYDIDNEVVKSSIQNYCSILSCFDNWGSDKVYFYYEDLLLISKSFDKTLKKLLVFLDCYDELMYKEFLHKKEFHKKNSMASLISKTATNGDSVLFHSNNLTDIQKWVSHIDINYPILKEKYLISYE